MDRHVTNFLRDVLGVVLEGSVAEAYIIHPSSPAAAAHGGGNSGRDGRGDGRGNGGTVGGKVAFRVNTWWEAAAIRAARGKLLRRTAFRIDDVLTPEEQDAHNRDFPRFNSMLRAGKAVRLFRGKLEEKIGEVWGPVTMPYDSARKCSDVEGSRPCASIRFLTWNINGGLLDINKRAEVVGILNAVDIVAFSHTGHLGGL